MVRNDEIKPEQLRFEREWRRVAHALRGVAVTIHGGRKLCFRSANQSPVGKRETAPRAPSDETSQRLFWF